MFVFQFGMKPQESNLSVHGGRAAAVPKQHDTLKTWDMCYVMCANCAIFVLIAEESMENKELRATSQIVHVAIRPAPC